MAARILIQDQERHTTVQPSWDKAWWVIGWFGFGLAVVGLADAAVNWYPLAFSSPEWEFGTISMTFGTLPMISMGLAGLLGSVLARGSRWGVIATSGFLLLLALVVLALFVVFLSDVPLALRATAREGTKFVIRRGIIRTGILGLGFSAGFLIAAVMSLVSLRRRVG